MTDHEFLSWLYDRLVLVYHESPNMDFVQRLRRIVDSHAPDTCQHCTCTYSTECCHCEDGQVHK